MYYYNARWYDPALGRFVQADTLVPQPGNPQALNRYAYSYDNPIYYSDPSGHFPGLAPLLLGIHVGLMETKHVLSHLPLAGMCPSNSCSPYARYETTVTYMQNEMIRNAQGVPAQAAKALNRAGLEPVAEGIWLWMAHPYSYWDHKPYLSAMLGLHQNGIEDVYFPIPGDAEHEYRVDIYSNAHFGFVSASAGFDEQTVQAAAALPFVAGRNDAYDVLSVHIGYELWEQTGGDPNQLTADMIRVAFLSHQDDYIEIWRQVYDSDRDRPGAVTNSVNGR